MTEGVFATGAARGLTDPRGRPGPPPEAVTAPSRDPATGAPRFLQKLDPRLPGPIRHTKPEMG